MSDEHYRQLQKLCRLCGGYRDRGWAPHCADYTNKLKEMYDLDINSDNADIQPRYLCLSCSKSLTGEEPRKEKLREWTEHSEDCRVCRHPPLSPPLKRRRSNPVSTNEVEEEEEEERAVRTKVQLKMKELNEHFLCGICDGYLVDCTTVTECLHSFCKSCIVRHLQSRQTCPTCKSLIHTTSPLQHILLDKGLQRLLDTIYPAVAEREALVRAEFEQETTADNSSSPSPESDGPPDDENTWFHRSDVKISISLEPSQKDVAMLESVPMKYIRCSMRLKVSHLEKYIRDKTSLKDELEITCNKTPLDGQLTLENIWLDTWKVKEAPMRLYYSKKT